MARLHPELPVRRVATTLLRVPQVDWAPIATSTKTELRTAGRYALLSHKVQPPDWPVLGWHRPRFSDRPKTMLLLIDEAWSEPLGAISPQSLAAEGYGSITEFRRYWNARHTRGYRADAIVQVVRLRPATPDDYPAIGRRLLERLYGPWLTA